MCATAKFQISSLFRGEFFLLEFLCRSAQYWAQFSRKDQVSSVKIERDLFASCQLSSSLQIANRRLDT